MLADVADLLRCPQCDPLAGAPLELAGRALRCPAGHTFDVARQGYVNLLSRATPPHADTPAMVTARERFLGSGAYGPLRRALARRVGGATTLLEAGAGTGYYLAGCLDADGSGEARRGLALDISPAAARRAARAHPRIGAVVADTWAGLPVRSGVVDLLLTVFAPRNPIEFARVLAPDGRLLVAVPLPEHLAELRDRLGLLDIEPDKEDRLLAGFAGLFQTSDHCDVRFPVALTPEAVADLVGMGPNAFHADHATRIDWRAPETVTVQVAVRIHEFARG